MPKPLAEYNAKRDFRKTAEPKGVRARRAGNSFVIQKHAASRLHYDFRLELDGVLKSWAVAKGPSLVPGEKRLAVHVEDHPLGYGAFEGTIPQGQYGGGTVMLWDRGTWEPEGDPHKDYEKGRLTFALNGEKLHGTWHLVRMRSRPGERRENWLLVKSDDAWARSADAPDILEEEPLSVATGRTMDEIAEGQGVGPKVWRSSRKSTPRTTPAKRQAATRRPPRRPARVG
jgi:bifunctional non-homologous end joining protein LigD